MCIAITLFSSQGLAYQEGDFLVRAGVAVIDPREESDSIDLEGIKLGEIGIESQNVPIANVSYFARDHLAFELLLSKPPVFDIVGTTGLVKGIPIGDMEVYPLVITAQYFPMAPSSTWQPFVGVGFNYVVSGDSNVNPDLAPHFGADSIKLEVEDSWGLTLSAGLDFMLSEKLLISAQAYYMDVDGRANGKVIIDGQDIDIDLFAHTGRAPVLYSITLGYIF